MFQIAKISGSILIRNRSKTKITKTLGSISIKYLPDTLALDWCLIYVDPTVFTILDVTASCVSDVVDPHAQ